MVGDHRTVTGGIARLAALIEQHCNAVEADLACIGIDLRELWRGDLTWRRLAVMVAALPSESVTATAVREALSPAQRRAAAMPRAGHGRWSSTDMLLAAVVDRLGLLLWQNGKRGAPKPQPVPRPGTERAQRVLSPAGVAYLSERRARRERALAAERGD